MTNETVVFEYNLPPKAVIYDRTEGPANLAELDYDGLMSFAHGTILILFMHNRDFIALDGSLFELMSQFEGVISATDAGKTETSTISGDYFSNSLSFYHESDTDRFTIQCEDYSVTTQYSAFRKAFFKFEQKLKRELLLFYPTLADNPNFM